MLLYFEKLKDLDFRQLMDIYEDSNLENGNEMYHFVSDNLKLLYPHFPLHLHTVLFRLLQEPSVHRLRYRHK